ncbi:MAG: trypsin-like peptidase domain-containing protein [Candidatus Thorarchaeota archaeon]|nr:trypsin-like peptidase domain-containing protein [Candidatus Thorarchaeota archaeon]
MFLEFERKLVEIVDRVVPSVVSVSTTRLARTQLSQIVPVQGQGSGVILTDTGFIVSNAHVVDGARDVEVTLNDGRTFKAVVVGETKTRDLAILRIEAEGLVPINMGDSSKLKVGQFTIAIGNPLGLGSSVTFGMVSAVDRTIQSERSFLEGLIQTSAQINPGNSGGALVDSEGKLIGVPTAMIPWSQGIGFAIAVDTLKDVFGELVETGTVRTPWMGIVGVTLNRGIASHYNLAIDTGALLLEVPKGPSRIAGLKPGDVIIAIDDVDMSGMEDLRKKVLRGKIGQKLRIRFFRNRDVLETYVELTSAPQ